jgi:phenylpropionate dioxygenase-like ring-hydroxylating dioxygenase large terminal subunit
MFKTANSKIELSELILADRVNGRLYRDPEMFEHEMKEIFGKVWVYLAHESELANKGDYVRRQVGLQPVILVRGSDNKIRVFFNRCRHRANLICNRDKGTGEVLVCPYHGWTYSNKGELIAPTFDEAYEPTLSATEFGLVPVPRVDSYRGLIFASLASSGISLREHLGQTVEFIDLIIDRSPSGQIELSAGVQKLRYRGNWKMLVENSVEGNYHGLFIHKFAFDLFDRHSGRDYTLPNAPCMLYLSGGHMVEDFRSVQFRGAQDSVQFRTGQDPVQKDPAQKDPAQKDPAQKDPAQKDPAQKDPVQKAYYESLVKVYGEKRAQDLHFGRTPIIFIFPNLFFVQTHIRRMQPIAVDDTLVYYQPAMLKDVPMKINENLLRIHETSFGPSGFLSPDDMEIMERNQVGLQALGDDWLFIGRGIHREERSPDGSTRGVDMDENHLRGMWRHYMRVMYTAAPEGVAPSSD